MEWNWPKAVVYFSILFAVCSLVYMGTTVAVDPQMTDSRMTAILGMVTPAVAAVAGLVGYEIGKNSRD